MSTRPDNVAPIFGGTGRHKPDSIKAVQGTFRPDRAKEEAQYEKVEKGLIPAPPDWMMDPLAREIFCEAFTQMADAGVLTVADIGLLEVYAVERAMLQRRYQQAVIVSQDENGEEVVTIVPMMAPGTEKLNAFRMLSSELGFTPVSRHKVVKQKPKNEKNDPWGDV